MTNASNVDVGKALEKDSLAQAKEMLDDDYRPTDSEEFMNPRQLEYFRNLLLNWKKSIHSEAEQVLAQLQDEPQVMLGAENPFGKETAAVVVKCRLPDGRIGLLGLVGPMRMNYPKNLGLIEEVIDILEE